jgi:hypothetical protein
MRRSTLGLGLEGPEYMAWLDQSPERHDTALMGATTYRLMSDFAATSGDPSFAQLTEMSKVVLLLDAEEPVGVGEHALGRPGPGRGRAVDEGRWRPPLRTMGSLTLCRRCSTQASERRSAHLNCGRIVRSARNTMSGVSRSQPGRSPREPYETSTAEDLLRRHARRATC